MRGLGAKEAAAILGVSIRSIRDVRWRSRVRLAGRRIGRRLVFTEQDLQALLRRSVERFPGRRNGRTGDNGLGEESREQQPAPRQASDAVGGQ